MPLHGKSSKAVQRSGQRQARKPDIAQPKLAVKGLLKQPPTAPPVYHPLPVAKVLQTKKPASQPPAYRPQTIPKVLQAKTRNQPSNICSSKTKLRGGHQVIQRLAISYPVPGSDTPRNIETDLLSLSALNDELKQAQGLYASLPSSPVKDRLQSAVSILAVESKEREEKKQVDAVRAQCDASFVRKHVLLNARTKADYLRGAWTKCARRDGEVFQNTVLIFNNLELAAFERAAMETFQKGGKRDDIYVPNYDIPLMVHSSEQYPDRISLWTNARVKVLVKRDGPTHAKITHLHDVGGGKLTEVYRFDREQATGKRFLVEIKSGHWYYLD